AAAGHASTGCGGRSDRAGFARRHRAGDGRRRRDDGGSAGGDRHRLSGRRGCAGGRERGGQRLAQGHRTHGGARGRPRADPADEGTLDEVARIIGHDVRDTDVMGATEAGVLSLVLLDADYENATKVIDRLVQRIDHYEFTTPLRISVGAACYPTHAVDPDSLK